MTPFRHDSLIVAVDLALIAWSVKLGSVGSFVLGITAMILGVTQ